MKLHWISLLATSALADLGRRPGRGAGLHPLSRTSASESASATPTNEARTEELSRRAVTTTAITTTATTTMDNGCRTITPAITSPRSGTVGPTVTISGLGPAQSCGPTNKPTIFYSSSGAASASSVEAVQYGGVSSIAFSAVLPSLLPGTYFAYPQGFGGMANPSQPGPAGTSVSFTVANCGVTPAVTSPLNRATVSSVYTYGGTAANSVCSNSVFLNVFTQGQGAQTVTATYINPTAWTAVYSATAPGVTTAGPLAIAPNGFSNYGYATHSVTILDCQAAPTITSPPSDGPIPNPTPTIAGNAPNGGCGLTVSVSISSIDGDASEMYEATYAGPTAFAVTLPSQPPGTYEVFAGAYSFAARKRDVANEGPTITITVPAMYTGGLDRRRKRARCAAGQDECIMGKNKVSGLVDYECVPALASNIERCGSCDGPDCSDIPNVDIVTCQQGKCVVETCVEGYSLLDGKCTPTAIPLQIQQ